MISNPVDRKKISDALREISDSMTRMSAEKDLIKDIIADLTEKFEIPKKTVSKMAKIYHKQNFNEEVKQFEDFEILYNEVVLLQNGQ